MAGGAVMITALFIAAGMEVSQTTATKVILYISLAVKLGFDGLAV